MMSEAMFGVRRAWRNPALSLLQFVPVGVDQGLEVGPEAGHVIVAWEAADHKHAFTITREFDADVSSDPFFVARVSWLDRSHQRRIGWKFRTFEAAVRLCSIYTGVLRRQVAYHEAGHAVTTWLLGFAGSGSTWRTIPIAPSRGTIFSPHCWRSRMPPWVALVLVVATLPSPVTCIRI